VPDHVCYVPIDFNTQTLAQQLLEAEYDPTLKTLFIWQGVTMYLTNEAVDATLDFMVKHSGYGSAVVFDYIYQEVLESSRQNEVANMRRYRFMTGEGLTFGIPLGTISSFLGARGFVDVKDISTDDLKAIYCIGKNAGRALVGGYGIVIGRI